MVCNALAEGVKRISRRACKGCSRMRRRRMPTRHRPTHVHTAGPARVGASYHRRDSDVVRVSIRAWPLPLPLLERVYDRSFASGDAPCASTRQRANAAAARLGCGDLRTRLTKSQW
ncbi:hypothetical protein SDC9_119166 [bioreactor metagenome]|uniref:Uncharacterized protein n=1 Tax=bioreactor metagenome TaxID=1076179 RepID=A0A645C8J5_9ZZZZ